jgi:hypothetical protein
MYYQQLHTKIPISKISTSSVDSNVNLLIID